MLAFIIRRLASTVIVMAIVGVFIFLLLHLSPGDPAAIIAGDNATQDQITASTIRCPCSLSAGPQAYSRATSESRSSPTFR
jgi:ABC-type dipeptide/oligopeptide/nickel transport system permease component